MIFGNSHRSCLLLLASYGDCVAMDTTSRHASIFGLCINVSTPQKAINQPYRGFYAFHQRGSLLLVCNAFLSSSSSRLRPSEVERNGVPY